MLNDIKEYFRFVIYKNSRILVNDLKETFEEVQTCLENQICPYLINNGGRIIISNIELSYNEKLIWKIIEQGELNIVETKEFDFNNIHEIITEDYINNFKEKHVLYPKELCVKSLISFMETISHFVYSKDLIDEVDILGICKITNNGVNNIVHEL